MAMEQQMEMFGANPMGGLDDDGMSRDPVSGNEIPPGSMANEVRDDVDAKLSDGEYVVPANVVRFFGVKFFEDLRTQAMQGLDTMEANGRIGGEPMPSDMPMQDQMAGSPEELTEQDMAMLQNIMNQGGDVRGYAHGGYHDPVNDPQPIPQSFPSSVYPLTQLITPGASTMNPNLNPNIAVTPTTPTTPVEDPNAGAGFKFVTLVNPATGEIQVVQFKGDVPVDVDAYNALINSGFYVQGSDELAAYKQKIAQDNRESDEQMGGDKPKTIQDLLQGNLYADMPLGPTGKVLGNIIGKAFPTTSNQTTIDYIIENGKFPPSGSGIRDFTKPLMGNGEYPFKRNADGTIQREKSKNGPRNVSLDQVQMLLEEAKVRKNNTDKVTSVLNTKAYREEMKKKKLAEKSGLSTIIADPNKWYKDWIKTQGMSTDLGFNDPDNLVFVDKGKEQRRKDTADLEAGRNTAGSGRAKQLEEKRLADYNAARRRMNEDNNDNDNNQSSGNVTAGTSTAQEVKDFKEDFQKAGGTWASGGRAKGGLIKKPTKKKKTKK